jgi:LL-diaminopimelate aminotransferase
MSKSFGMPGIRVGFIVANSDFIGNLKGSKYLSGTSTYKPLQKAASAALKDEKYIESANEEYIKRKDVCVKRLKQLGCNIEPSEGTFYLWAKIPDSFKSQEFFKYVLHKAHVAFTPGTALGKNGEGYIRIVLSDTTDKINEAFDNIENAGIRFDTPKDKLPVEVQKEIEEISNSNYK